MVNPPKPEIKYQERS